MRPGIYPYIYALCPDARTVEFCGCSHYVIPYNDRDATPYTVPFLRHPDAELVAVESVHPTLYSRANTYSPLRRVHDDTIPDRNTASVSNPGTGSGRPVPRVCKHLRDSE